MTSKLTKDEKVTNYETITHIRLVSRFMNVIVREILDRADHHDDSKLEAPEVAALTVETKNLHGLTYGSAEYFEQLQKPEMKAYLEHHYANNRHHPDHFKHGIEEMNLIDIVEMFCDWNASCRRHANGNIRKSIEKNEERFGINPQLVKIFENTTHLFE